MENIRKMNEIIFQMNLHYQNLTEKYDKDKNNFEIYNQFIDPNFESDKEKFSLQEIRDKIKNAENDLKILNKKYEEQLKTYKLENLN